MQDEFNLESMFMLIIEIIQKKYRENFVYLRQIPSFKAEKPPSHVFCDIFESTCNVETHNQTQGDNNGLEYRLVIVTKDSS